MGDENLRIRELHGRYGRVSCLYEVWIMARNNSPPGKGHSGGDESPENVELHWRYGSIPCEQKAWMHAS